MCCEQIERQLGRYVDNELSAAERDTVEAHIESCSSCRAELEELRDLVADIAKPVSARVPDSLWAGIERRLAQAEQAGVSGKPVRPGAVGPPPLEVGNAMIAADRATGVTGSATERMSSAPPCPKDMGHAPSLSRPVRLRFLRAPWAIAAGLVLAVGLGLFGLSSLETSAQASTVDFGMLLDALPLDAQKAFRKFLIRYDAKPTTPIAAKQAASSLNFNTPPVLPGGFRLQSVYELRIGRMKGIAAAYDRNGEFLAVVFHPPMKHERFGSHESFPCVIGKQCGHKVQVGDWKLVHLTDPTTCHCLLTRLNEQTEMPAVMEAIAPKLSEIGADDGHHDR